MKIAIISDTHIHKHPGKIVDIINNYMRGVDMIIHAGDYTDIGVVNILKKYNNFIGVWGNNDNQPIRAILKEKEIVTVEGYNIGICHGHNGSGRNTMEVAYNTFKNDKVDIIVFGHSHQPSIVTKNKTLMLNPGSLTYRHKERWHSYIILEIEKSSVNASLKFITG